jgi:MFS superfamily sulfate permease-like transporter
MIYMRPCDGRYEELKKGTIARNVVDDITAGLVLSLMSVPLAMGFAMASGLRPEQGIVGGAVAAIFGAVFGGSKYLIYGPTAAFIPVIAGLMAAYNHGFLVLASLIAGFMLLLSGFLRLGRIIEKIPQSIVVGFTTGIAIIIVFSQAGQVLGLREKTGTGLIEQVTSIVKNIDKVNIAAIAMAAMTILFCKVFDKISTYIPGLVPALIFGYFGGQTFWSDKGLETIGDQYGSIMTNFFVFTPPILPETWNSKTIFDLFFYSFAFFTIAAIKSLLYGRSADRLAENKGFPFSPNRELRGLGLANIFSPLFNGFPHTGTLGRTALSIRLKGRSPLTAIAKSIFVITISVLLAKYLAKIPMACIAGILLYVARGMVKKREINKIVSMNNYHIILMCVTVIAVPLFGFMSGVVTAIILYAVFYRLFEKKKPKPLINKNKWRPES